MSRIKEGTSSDQARPDADTSQTGQVFRREGDYWTIIYDDTTVRLRDTIGLRYVAHLLARPHQRLAVQELLAAVKGISCSDVERARSAVSKRLRDGAAPRAGTSSRPRLPPARRHNDRRALRVRARSGAAAQVDDMTGGSRVPGFWSLVWQ